MRPRITRRRSTLSAAAAAAAVRPRPDSHLAMPPMISRPCPGLGRAATGRNTPCGSNWRPWAPTAAICAAEICEHGKPVRPVCLPHPAATLRASKMHTAVRRAHLLKDVGLGRPRWPRGRKRLACRVGDHDPQVSPRGRVLDQLQRGGRAAGQALGGKRRGQGPSSMSCPSNHRDLTF